MTPHGPDEFNRRILDTLRRLATQVRVHVFMRGLSECIAIAFVLFLAQFVIDYVLVLDRLPRAVLALVLLVTLARQVTRRFVRPLAAPIDPIRISATLERMLPGLGDRLISAVQFSLDAGRPAGVTLPDESQAMRSAVIESVLGDVEQIRTVPFVRSDRMKRAVAGIVIVTVATILAATQKTDLFAAWLQRDLLLADAPWPIRYRIDLVGADNGEIIVPRGDNLVVTTDAIGSDTPRSLSMEFRIPDAAEGLRPMSRTGSARFRCDFGALTDSMQIRFRTPRWGRDETSEWYTVTAVDRPRVAESRVTVAPPKYTRVTPYELPAGQLAADIPEGSHVTIAIRTNKPVTTAELKSADQTVTTAAVRDDGWLVAEIDPQRTAGFQFHLVDDLELIDTRPLTFSMRLLPDRAPTVRLTLPGVGNMLLPNAVIPYSMEFEDNWGLADAQFIYTVDHVQTATQPVEATQTLAGLEANQKTFSHRGSLAVEALDLKAMDNLLLSARASDFKDFGEPNIGTSAIHTLRIVTREELEAELTRRELEWRQEFEQVIKSQEAVRIRLRELELESDANARLIRFAREERAELQIAARVRKVHDQFRQIASEYQINQLMTNQLQHRIDDGVIYPLNGLMAQNLPLLAEAIGRAARNPAPEETARVDLMIQEVLNQMNVVLGNMLKWEGYNEATALLREIMKQQGDVNRQTQEELDQQIERLFGPQTPAN